MAKLVKYSFNWSINLNHYTCTINLKHRQFREFKLVTLRVLRTELQLTIIFSIITEIPNSSKTASTNCVETRTAKFLNDLIKSQKYANYMGRFLDYIIFY